MTIGAFLVGRTAGKIHSPYSGTQKVYGSELLDGMTLDKPSYEHCTFANISFKGVTLTNGHFLNCAFIGCYFRNSDIKSSNFSSSRFINCEFPGISLSGCDFRYTRFVDCYVPFAEMEHNLPPEPNLREQLTHNLAREAAALGDSREARTYRLREIQAREAHYWAVILGNSRWYRDHYDAFARLGIAFRLAGSLINGVVFGYGERLRVLVKNYLIATFVLFPILFYAISNGLSDRSKESAGFVNSSLRMALEFSVKNAVVGALESSVQAVGWTARLLAATETILAAIWASLVAAYVVRWSIRR